MIDNFVITEITRVVYVDKNEYPEKVTKFQAKELKTNELIFHYSGKATVYFNGQVLQTSENTIRFLPKGECREYIVDREEIGDCILICFNADRQVGDIAETAFVKNEKVGVLFKQLFLKWVQKDEQYYFECIRYSNFNFVPHMHRHPEVFCVREGSLAVEMNGKREIFNKGDYGWIPSNFIH